MYRGGFYEGAKSYRSIIENNNLNKSLKKNHLDNHFELGGRTLVSPDPASGLRLLESEKSLTYFKHKELSNEPNELRSKFKTKIER